MGRQWAEKQRKFQLASWLGGWLVVNSNFLLNLDKRFLVKYRVYYIPEIRAAKVFIYERMTYFPARSRGSILCLLFLTKSTIFSVRKVTAETDDSK